MASQVTTPVTDQALSFDGTDDFARAADSVSLSVTADISVEAWIKPDRVTGSQAILSKRKSGTGGADYGGYELRLDGNLVTFETFKNDGTVKATITSTATVSTSSWYHVAGCYDEIVSGGSGSGTMYVTVTQAQPTGTTMTMTVKSASVSASGPPDGGAPLQLGRTLTSGSTGINFYDGQIDEARVSNLVRYTTSTQPSKSHASDGNTRGLWKMQNPTTGVGSDADSSANGNTLTRTSPTDPVFVATGITSTNKLAKNRRGKRRGRELAPDSEVGLFPAGHIGAADSLDQTGEAWKLAAVGWQRRYAYDRWGNRTNVYDALSGGTTLQTVALVDTNLDGVPDSNRIKTVTENVTSPNYGYDAVGNQTFDGVTTLTYDAANRITAAGSSNYAYDSENRRTKKVSGGMTTHYVWEGGRVIAEYNGATGALLVEYVFAGDSMVAKIEGGVTSYLHSDRLSIRLITNASGMVVGTASNFAFGAESGGTGTATDKHQFTSYERDAETDTDYAMNRQYVTSSGRFSRPDPVMGSLTNPRSLNRYAYAHNDPINLVDPLGLDPYIGSLGSIDVFAGDDPLYANGAEFGGTFGTVYEPRGLDDSTLAWFVQYVADQRCNEKIARMFGGPGVVAAATGREPFGFVGGYAFRSGQYYDRPETAYPRGHLNDAIHLYGPEVGNSDFSVFVPAGGKRYGRQTDGDGIVTFHYDQLGNAKDVTVAVFHVKLDSRTGAPNGAGSTYIGTTGGPGNTPGIGYTHIHIEIWKGDKYLAPGQKRWDARLSPKEVLC